MASLDLCLSILRSLIVLFYKRVIKHVKSLINLVILF